MSPLAPQPTEVSRKSAAGGEKPSQAGAAGSGASEFESAVRSLQELRSVALAEMSALFGLELDRYRDVWRHAFDSVKGTLAELERACDSATGKNPVEATAALSSIVERLVSAATSAAEAAAQRARAESRAEVANVQQTLKDVSAELQRIRDESVKQRNELKSVRDTLATEQAARAKAESALEEARGQSSKTVASYESQVQSLRTELWGMQQQVEGERATRSRLIAAIRQVVDVDVPGGDEKVFAPADFRPEDDSTKVAKTASAEPEPREAPVPEGPPPDPALVTYVQHLLDTAESMYNADVASRRATTDLVDRLTDHLRSARVLFLQRTGITSDRREPTLFDQLLTHRLNTTEDTPFGRHLGIAAHACLTERSRDR